MLKRFTTLAAAGLLASAVLCAAPAFATSNSQGLTVNGSVTQSCSTLSSAQTLTFTAYDFQANATSPDDAGPVSYTTQCTKGSSVAFSVNGGANYAHTANTRAMKSSTTSDYLNYALYQDAGRSNAWAFDSTSGSGTNGPTLNPTSDTQTLTLTIYGRIPAGQDVSVASDYADAVTVAINY